MSDGMGMMGDDFCFKYCTATEIKSCKDNDTQITGR